MPACEKRQHILEELWEIHYKLKAKEDAKEKKESKEKPLEKERRHVT